MDETNFTIVFGCVGPDQFQLRVDELHVGIICVRIDLAGVPTSVADDVYDLVSRF